MAGKTYQWGELTVNWIINNVPGWIMIAVLGALLSFSAVYMIKDERSRNESIIGGTAVLITGAVILALGIFLLVTGKNGSFGSYM